MEKRCSKCQIIKSVEEFRKRRHSLDGYNGKCCVCVREYESAWLKKNPDKNRKKRATWRKAHPEREKAIRDNWLNKNRGRHNSYYAKRRAAILQRTPKWADLKAIQQFYQNCPKGYEVDHVIPLQGKNVSGLHVLNNLQYLPMSENRSKGNRMLSHV